MRHGAIAFFQNKGLAYACCLRLCAVVAASAMVFASAAAAEVAKPVANADPSTGSIHAYLDTIDDLSTRLAVLDEYIAALDATSPMDAKISLDQERIVILANLGDARVASDFASTIYRKYDRTDFADDVAYGKFYFQLLRAFAKSVEISKAFQSIQMLREAIYEQPDVHLQYFIERALMEIYIETFSFDRAIETQLSIINNEQYQDIEDFKQWRFSLLNEIAFAYNKVGNGQKALEFLTVSREALGGENFSGAKLERALAMNDGNRGRAYLLIKDYEAALEMGYNVLAVGQKLGQHYPTGLGHRLVGSAALRLGDLETAEVHLREGIAVAELNNISILRDELYRDYAALFEAKGIYDQALVWVRRSNALQQTAMRASTRAKIALHVAEEEAKNTYTEIQRLRLENAKQRAIQARDDGTKVLLGTVALFLFSMVAFLIYVTFVQKRSRAVLAASNKKAQEANEAKSAFLANMSHEIRTPMNGVLGMAEILKSTSLSDEQKTYADTIYNSGSALITIINDILDFSKIESGKFELDPTPCNLKTAIEEVATLLSMHAHQKQIEIFFRYNPSLPDQVLVDIGCLRQIITNLVGNAIKFTHEGHVLIDVDGAVEDGQVAFRVSIQDTGIGIAAGKLDEIFHTFTQAENSTTRKYGGTGLGLAISKQLARKMGGDVSVTSVKGKGSTFTIDLELPVSLSGDAGAARPCFGQGKQALIIDAHELNTKILAEYLSSWGFAVQTAQSSEDVMALIDHCQQTDTKIDLAVVDLQPGGAAPLDLIELRRSSSVLADTKVLGMSCSSGQLDQDAPAMWGGDDRVTKPIRPTQLADTIEHILSGISSGELHKDQTAPATASPAPFCDQQYRILVAEDNQVNRMVIQSFLDRPDIQLSFAVNGREAVASVEQDRFDMILMDISMPEMDGISATKAIRVYETANEKVRTPIIGLSAHVSAEDKQIAMDAGMDAYATKPINKVELNNIITQWCRAKSDGTSASVTAAA